MEKLTKTEANTIINWLYHNGREMDMAIFNTLFNGDEKEFVLQGATLYETDNGAFGKGVNPDNQNQEANILSCETVFEILQLVGYRYKQDDEFFNEIIGSACKYLFNQAPMKDEKWCIIEKENNNYPCAQWWKYVDEEHACLPFYPTPALIGQIMLFTSPNSKYYEKAESMVNGILKDYLFYNVSDKSDLHSMYLLLKALKELQYDDPLVEEVHAKWLQDIDYSITRKKELFRSTVSTLILDIVYDCELLEGKFKDEINDNLDYIIDSRSNTGMWNINWTWGNDDSYYDVASILWASILAVQNLYLLKTFGRIEEGAL